MQKQLKGTVGVEDSGVRRGGRSRRIVAGVAAATVLTGIFGGVVGMPTATALDPAEKAAQQGAAAAIGIPMPSPSTALSTLNGLYGSYKSKMRHQELVAALQRIESQLAVMRGELSAMSDQLELGMDAATKERFEIADSDLAEDAGDLQDMWRSYVYVTTATPVTEQEKLDLATELADLKVKLKASLQGTVEDMKTGLAGGAVGSQSARLSKAAATIQKVGDNELYWQYVDQYRDYYQAQLLTGAIMAKWANDEGAITNNSAKTIEAHRTTAVNAMYNKIGVKIEQGNADQFVQTVGQKQALVGGDYAGQQPGTFSYLYNGAELEKVYKVMADSYVPERHSGTSLHQYLTERNIPTTVQAFDSLKEKETVVNSDGIRGNRQYKELFWDVITISETGEYSKQGQTLKVDKSGTPTAQYKHATDYLIENQQWSAPKAFVDLTVNDAKVAANMDKAVITTAKAGNPGFASFQTAEVSETKTAIDLAVARQANGNAVDGTIRLIDTETGEIVQGFNTLSGAHEMTTGERDRNHQVYGSLTDRVLRLDLGDVQGAEAMDVQASALIVTGPKTETITLNIK
jgi:hypothetical protein